MDLDDTGREATTPDNLARTRSPKFIIAALATPVLVTAIGAWAYYSPAWTVDRMRALADAGDTRSVMEFVDLPAFKVDLKDQLRTQAAKVVADQQGSGVGLMAGIATEATLDQTVNFMASPDAIAMAFNANPSMDAIPPGGLHVLATTLERDGLLQFRLHSRSQKARHGDLIFRLQGPSWRLVGINLPDSSPVERPVFGVAPPDLQLDFPPNRIDRRTLPNGKEFFGASGKVTNIGKQRRTVPPILIVLRDSKERIVYSWEVRSPKQQLNPGESVTINEAVTDVPRSARFAEVGWKPG